MTDKSDERKSVEQLMRVLDNYESSDSDIDLAREAVRAVLATAPAEPPKEALIERCALIAEAQPYYPDTHTGTRQQWVKEQIAAKIRALVDHDAGALDEAASVAARAENELHEARKEISRLRARLSAPVPARECKHERSKWNILGTHGTCQDCGASLPPPPAADK